MDHDEKNACRVSLRVRPCQLEFTYESLNFSKRWQPSLASQPHARHKKPRTIVRNVAVRGLRKLQCNFSRSCTATFQNPALQNYKAKHKSCSAAKRPKTAIVYPHRGVGAFNRGGFANVAVQLHPAICKRCNAKTLGGSQPVRSGSASPRAGRAAQYVIMS